MINFSDLIVGIVRTMTGTLLVLIGIQPLTSHQGMMPYSIFPIHLPDTGFVMMDVMIRLLFIGFGICVILGIRTRLLAAFMMSVTLFEGIQCIQSNPTWTAGHVLFVIMIGCLSMLIILGGGRYSLHQGGWSDIPF